MKLCRCPVCHASISLDALVEDDAGRELMGILAKNPKISRALVAYLTLFRPEKRDLSNSRAATLVREALELEKDQDILRVAMIEAVEAARAKRVEWKPPKNHNWLKAFIKNARAAQNLEPEIKPRKHAPPPDIPHDRVRAEHDKQPGMPENIRALMIDALKGKTA